MPQDPPTAGDLLERILAARGLGDPDDRAAFLAPDLKLLTESNPLSGTEKATDILLDSIREKRPIVIYGDYDVDGITATSILWHVIRAIDPEAPISTYVPHRLEEGYGLNPDAIRSLHEEGARTIITVDCGVTAVEEARLARELGVDLIITDHHRAREDGELPDAAAIVHPSLPGKEHEFTELAGAGVAWKIALHLARKASGSNRVGPSLQNALMDALSLSAMGTIADVMPLQDENRIIASFGLRHMGGCRNIGVQALLRASGAGKGRNDAEMVGFRLGPRLNAAGRMGHAASAIELFTTADDIRAEELAHELTELNTKRQAVEKAITTRAHEMVLEQGMAEPGSHAIVLRHQDWHPGVVGIVCSRLVEKYGRPTILMQDDGEFCRGSARSISGYSIHEALGVCDEHLETYGGHHMAAGMTLASDSFEDFARDLIKHANDSIPESHLMPELKIDLEVDRTEISGTVIRKLSAMKPFGRGNPGPRVLLKDMRVLTALAFGRSDNHLKLRLGTEDERSKPIEAIWWGQAERLEQVRHRSVDVVAKMEIDSYSKRESLVIDDIAMVNRG